MVSNHLQVLSSGFSRRGGGGLGRVKLHLRDLKKRRVLNHHVIFSSSNIPTCGPLSWPITIGYGEKSWSICLCYYTSYSCMSNCIVFHPIQLLDIPRSTLR